MTITNAEIKGRLIEEKARLHPDGDTQDPAGNRTLKRFWDGILEEEIEAARAFLLKWTSTKNFTDDSSAAAPTVVNPWVNGRALSGTFRGGPVTKEPMEEREQAGPVRWKLVQELGQFSEMTATGTGTSDELTADAFEQTQTEVKDGQTAALADTAAVAQTAGTIVEVRSVRNLWGLFKTTKRTRTATEQTESGAAATFSATEKVQDYESKNLEDEPALPTETAAGVIQTIRKRLNLFLRWDREESTRTAVALEWTWTWNTGIGDPAKSGYGWAGINVTDVVAIAKIAAVTGDWEYVISASKDATQFPGLFNYQITKTPRSGASGGSAKYTDYGPESEPIEIWQYAGGERSASRIRRKLTGTYYARGDRDENKAMNVTGTATKVNHGYQFKPSADGRFFQAEGVVITNWGAWETDSATA